jgi:low temperature requirement protein LtrA
MRMPRFQRSGAPEEERHATPLELFYDLVFVFAITQVSHLLLKHLTWEGAGQSLLVLLVVWWAWNYTTWVTNELDPESIVVRLVLIAVMLASLLMAVAIPEAFGRHALLFAGSYVAIQVGRHAFLTFGAGGPGTIERERASRILTWFVAAGVLWIAGALAHGTARTVLWLAALALDYSAPLAVFWVPGRRRMRHDMWQVQTSHFAERFQLFIIIALGESIVVIGATTSELELNLARLVAFGIAFLETAAMWWLYFNYVARIAERRLELSPDRTLLARDAYTYLHVVLVAGVIVAAVGDELVIAHPSHELPGREIAAVVAGPAIYLLAHAVFRWRMSGSVSGRRLAGALACVAAGGVGAFAPALVVAALVVAILVAVIGSEYLAGARSRARGEPSPLERLEASAAASTGGGPAAEGRAGPAAAPGWAAAAPAGAGPVSGARSSQPPAAATALAIVGARAGTGTPAT